MDKFKQVKVSGGKLLQLEKVGEVYKITGDFFCYPETVVGEMEEILSSSDSLENKKSALELVFENNEVIGFGSEDLLNLYAEIC